MYHIELYALGSVECEDPPWLPYREENDNRRPIKTFTDPESAKQLAGSLTAKILCLARIVDDRGNIFTAFDDKGECSPDESFWGV